MGNCLQGCMNALNDLKDRKVVCPKCKKHRWNKRKPKDVFLKEGCIMCTMREKYKFKNVLNECLDRGKKCSKFWKIREHHRGGRYFRKHR